MSCLISDYSYFNDNCTSSLPCCDESLGYVFVKHNSPLRCYCSNDFIDSHPVEFVLIVLFCVLTPILFLISLMYCDYGECFRNCGRLIKKPFVIVKSFVVNCYTYLKNKYNPPIPETCVKTPKSIDDLMF